MQRITVVALLVASPFFGRCRRRALRQQAALGRDRVQHQDRRLRLCRGPETKRDAETEAFRVCGTNAICSGPSGQLRRRRGEAEARRLRHGRLARDRRAKALKKCGDNCKIAVWACTSEK